MEKRFRRFVFFCSSSSSANCSWAMVVPRSPDIPSTITSRASWIVRPIMATLLYLPLATSSITDSAPVLVLPKPRPAIISQIHLSSIGILCSGLAISCQLFIFVIIIICSFCCYLFCLFGSEGKFLSFVIFCYLLLSFVIPHCPPDGQGVCIGAHSLCMALAPEQKVCFGRRRCHMSSRRSSVCGLAIWREIIRGRQSSSLLNLSRKSIIP